MQIHLSAFSKDVMKIKPQVMASKYVVFLTILTKPEQEKK